MPVWIIIIIAVVLFIAFICWTVFDNKSAGSNKQKEEKTAMVKGKERVKK